MMKQTRLSGESVIIVGDKSIAFLKEIFSTLGKVIALPSEEITPKTIKNADVLLVRSVTKVDEKLLKACSVKFVGTATIGTDHIDTEYLKKAGITLASAPGSNSNAVAEYVITCLLVLGKKYNFFLHGKSIGIIGAGNVGGKVAQKCEALGITTLLNDPPLARRTKDKKYLLLSALFDADIITLHTPLTYTGRDATYHIVDQTFLSRLKDGAVLINTSRGEVIDESALLKHIRRFKAVALDVWENEPNVNIELLRNIALGTPHIAGYSLEGKTNTTIMIYRKLCLFLKRTPENVLLSPPHKAIKKPVNEEDTLVKIATKFCDIETDDRNLRKILTLPSQDRGKYFETLRKNYKFRREFRNTTLKLNNC